MNDYRVQIGFDSAGDWQDVGQPYPTAEEAWAFRRTLLDGASWHARVVKAHTTFEVLAENVEPHTA